MNEYHTITNKQRIIYKEYLSKNKFYKNLFFIFCKLFKKLVLLKEKNKDNLNYDLNKI